MRTSKHFYGSITLTVLLFAGFSAGSIAQDTSTIVNPKTKAPVIIATSPADGETNVNRNSIIEITFSSEMDAASINSNTLLLHAMYKDTLNEEYGEMRQNQITGNLMDKESENSSYYTTGTVNGTISYANKIAVFTPDQELKEDTQYTFTVTNGAKNSENIALENDQSWGFTTIGTSSSTYFDKQNDQQGMEEAGGRAMHAMSTKMHMMSAKKMKSIDLGKAGQFVILAKTSVKNNSTSKITGHIGEGSVATDTNKEQDTLKATLQTNSEQVSVLQSNLMSDKTAPDVNAAIKDMMSAYNDASMQNGNDSTSHKNERFDSVVLTPGVHEWSDSLHIASNVTLSGSADDVWLIKVGENLSIDENVEITLTNGARPENIFWYVDGEVTIGKNAHFEGIILSMNEIKLEKGAIVNGRMFSQSSITLDGNTVTEPRKMTGQTTSKNKEDR